MVQVGRPFAGRALPTGGRVLHRLQTQDFVEAVQRAKPTGAKGTYMKKVSIASTMGPGVSVDLASATGNG